MAKKNRVLNYGLINRALNYGGPCIVKLRGTIPAPFGHEIGEGDRCSDIMTVALKKHFFGKTGAPKEMLHRKRQSFCKKRNINTERSLFWSEERWIGELTAYFQHTRTAWRKPVKRSRPSQHTAHKIIRVTFTRYPNSISTITYAFSSRKKKCILHCACPEFTLSTTVQKITFYQRNLPSVWQSSSFSELNKSVLNLANKNR